MSDADAVPSFDVAVLGAGPAGLAAALRLARDGRSVVVLERGAGPGGLAGSFEVAGIRVDHGAHRLDPTCDPHVLAVLQGLMGDDLRLRAHHDRVRVDGRWLDFPVRTRSGAAAIQWPYAEKLWGVAPDRLELDLGRVRFGAGPQGQHPPTRRLGRGRPDDGYVARRGHGQIAEVLAGAAVTAGAEIRFGADVHRVRADGSGVDVTTADGRRIRAGRVASSLPLPVLVRVSGGVTHRGGTDVPPAVRDAATGLEYRSLVLVYLVVDRSRYTDCDVHVLPDREVAALRVSEPTHARAEWGTDPSVTVLCAELPCTVGDPVWAAADADLAARVVDDLRAVDLPDLDPVEVVVRRVPRAFPVPVAGVGARLAVIHEWLAEQPRVVTFGRQGTYALDDTHQSLAAGWTLPDE